MCSDEDDDDDDDEDEEDDDEEEDIEESPVKARSCFGSSSEYIWWVVSLIYFNFFGTGESNTVQTETTSSEWKES